MGRGPGEYPVSQAQSKPILDECYWPKAVQESLGEDKWKLNEFLNEERVRGKQLAKSSDL